MEGLRRGMKRQKQDEAQVPDRYRPSPGLAKAQQPTGSPGCKGWVLRMVSLGSRVETDPAQPDTGQRLWGAAPPQSTVNSGPAWSNSGCRISSLLFLSMWRLQGPNTEVTGRSTSGNRNLELGVIFHSLSFLLKKELYFPSHFPLCILWTACQFIPAKVAVVLKNLSPALSPFP